MSRSYKKTPIIKGAGSGPYGKRCANRKVRRTQTILLQNKRAYKKLYESWDINDYISRWTRKDAEKSGEIEIWEKFYDT